MSLNCLKGGIKKTDSDDILYNQEKTNVNRFLARVETNWSGELRPRPNYGKMRTGSNLMVDNNKAKQAHRHTQSDEFDDPATPRLVRSPGIRRDWSFEDLRRGVQVQGY